MKLSMFDLVIKIQEELNQHGENLTVDGGLGPKTLSAMEKFDFEVTATRVPAPPQKSAEPERKPPPWYLFAKTFEGKTETDPEFAGYMIPKWKLFGMALGTIAKGWAAWCGLAMAVALSGVGLDYAKNGALAANWANYGVEIDWRKHGIPQGAIVQLALQSGNHVGQANGDCTPADLMKPDAVFDLYGGNQGNSWKVSAFKASSIGAVRWPKDKDHPRPAPVTKSWNCHLAKAMAATSR